MKKSAQEKSIIIAIEMNGLPPVEQIKKAILDMDYKFFSKESIEVSEL